MVLLLSSVLISTQSVQAGPVHAYYADEHNTTSTSPTGNRILEIDIESMSLVNSLDVPGFVGHHADNGFNSKIYGVPKESGYVNVVELRKDLNGTQTTMEHTKKIPLIHKPRSGDAYNKKFNVILMSAANRPMGSFINVETDEVVGTIGEDVDCTLTDGSQLLSHADANTIAAATKYQCAIEDHGGDQVSGHPYWLTPDYAAIVDRTNRQISTYFVWQEGNQLKSRLVNHLPTRTAIHQIVPRDRTALPSTQQADFYAVEEGKHADDNLAGGIAHALLKLKLTTNGLVLEKRMDLQRTEVLPKVKAQRILDSCVANYRNENNYRQGRTLTQAYLDLFNAEGITLSPDQDEGVNLPVECFYPGVPGGHNADFAPNNKHIYVGMAAGVMSIIDVNRWKIVNNLDIGRASGPGHTCFSQKHNIALTTNHGKTYTRVIRNINSERPTISQYLPLGFSGEGLINTYQSHTCYIDEEEEFYYNFWTDGGVFYKMDLAAIAANTQNGNPNMVVASLVTGGIPIQGSFIDLDDIKTNTPQVVLEAKNDTANSDGSAVTIDVLANDSGTGLSVTQVDSADYGTVSIVNNKVVYTPITGFSGTDGFWYKVTDSRGWYTWGYAEIKVTSNQPQVVLEAFGDSISSNGAEAVLDVLANDTGTGLTISEVEEPGWGTATIVGNKITYKPRAGATGTDEFWYKVTDSRGWYTWGKVSVTFNQTSTPAPTPAPVFSAVNDNVTTAAGAPITISVLSNDIGTGLKLSDVEDAGNGTVTIVNNTIVYTPKTGFSGVDEFWYEITDSRGYETWGQVLVTVQ